MPWVVDTSVLLDIRRNDPTFGRPSAECLVRHLPDGLVICPVTYVELAPEFDAREALQEQFLQEIGVESLEPWTRADTQAAHRAWADHVRKKRAGQGSKRPVADVLIEAFAQRFQGLITRNPKALYERAGRGSVSGDLGVQLQTAVTGRAGEGSSPGKSPVKPFSRSDKPSATVRERSNTVEFNNTSLRSDRPILFQ